MIQIFYFSPTGNVKYLAEKLAAELNSDTTLSAMENTIPSEIPTSEKMVMMYPVHAFNAPRTVLRFLKELPLGICNEISLLAIGCNETWINSASSILSRKELEKRGFTITVDRVLAMPLTMVYDFPKDLKLPMISCAEKRVKKIAHEIVFSKKTHRTVPLKAKILRVFGSFEDYAARLFGLELFASQDCTSCGNCIDRCPEQNIVFNKSEKPVFKFRCLMCMRCIYECPEHAIKPRFSRFIPLKNGYTIQDKT